MITTVSFEESERPTEWLRALREDPRRFSLLVSDSGSLARAAWRLARARCAVQSVPTKIPTLRELFAASRELAERLGQPCPHPTLIGDECERAGLEVISPLSRSRAA